MEAEATVAAEREVRVTDSIARAGDWALVLHAAGIDNRVDIRDGVLVLLVAANDAPAALTALDAFDVESRPVVEVPMPDLGPTVLGWACAALLVFMWQVTGPGDARPSSTWFDVGSGASTAILHGESWRLVTALMLHGDLMHLIGNVVASLLFVSAVGRWLGAGLGGLLVVASAAFGNLLTALAYGPGHVSIGASTATFAALGLLAGGQMARRFGHANRRRRAWLPLAAGLGLVILLGTSERADVVAHLCGLGAGVAAGGMVSAASRRPPGRFIQAMLAVLTIAVIVGSWWCALRT